MLRGTGACDRNRDLVIELLSGENPNLKAIAKRVGTSWRHVKAFATRERIEYRKHSRMGRHNGHWGGGRIVTRQGYVLVHCPEHPRANYLGYCWEHRLVMEEVLGRYLKPSEVVHHKDEKRSNNHPSNLAVFESNAKHLRYELNGKTPNWTPHTLAMQKQWLAQGRETLRQRSLKASIQSGSTRK